MSRYIDADEIRWADHYDSDGNLSKYKVAYSDEMPPAIDAVPISFIEKKIESIRKYLQEHEGEEFTSGLISKAITYERLIEEWREENETD
jgi:hypothetical protein